MADESVRMRLNSCFACLEFQRSDDTHYTDTSQDKGDMHGPIEVEALWMGEGPQLCLSFEPRAKGPTETHPDTPKTFKVHLYLQGETQIRALRAYCDVVLQTCER